MSDTLSDSAQSLWLVLLKSYENVLFLLLQSDAECLLQVLHLSLRDDAFCPLCCCALSLSASP